MFRIVPLAGQTYDFEVEKTQLSLFADVVPDIDAFELRLNVSGRNQEAGNHGLQGDTACPLFEVRGALLSVSDVQLDWKRSIETASFNTEKRGENNSAHLSFNGGIFELAPGDIRIKFMGKATFSLAVEGKLCLRGVEAKTKEFGRFELVCLLPFEGVWIEHKGSDNADAVEALFAQVFNEREYDVDRDVSMDAFVIRAQYIGS